MKYRVLSLLVVIVAVMVWVAWLNREKGHGDGAQEPLIAVSQENRSVGLKNWEKTWTDQE